MFEHINTVNIGIYFKIFSNFIDNSYFTASVLITFIVLNFHGKEIIFFDIINHPNSSIISTTNFFEKDEITI